MFPSVPPHSHLQSGMQSDVDLQANFVKVIKLTAEDLEKLEAPAANGKAKRINTPLWGWDLGFDDWYGPKK
ncbi:hypothetical protein I203_100862 [Kwoniella mangroviensis CBS 8507]|uniref:uncharacterized protein n=1 Tax=Kwoniella mangroviensis CBS 8507 TaxID=1296122 RepID=UPI003028F482